MFEHELEAIRSKAGALKADITSIATCDETKAASELVDQAVNKVEAFLALRAQHADQQKDGGPKVSGNAGLVNDGREDPNNPDHRDNPDGTETEEVEEEVEEDEVDDSGKATGAKKKVVKKTTRAKSKAK